MAERVAVELARAWHGRRAIGNDYIASTAVQVRLASAPEAQAALRDAPAVVAEGGEVGSVTGDGGVVMYVHGGPGDEWSLVVPFLPATSLVFVCADDLDGHCMQVYADSEEAEQAISDLYTAVTLALKYDRVTSRQLPPERPPGRATQCL